MKLAQLNLIEPYFVNAFTKIQGALPNGSGAGTNLSPSKSPMITIDR
jgi:hypothetical protein